MKKCKICNTNLWVHRKKRFGLCKSCFDNLKENLLSEQKLIDEKIHSINNSAKPITKLQHCNEIISQAKQYVSYEEMGVQTLNPKPSELISRYIKQHDEIIINLTHDKVDAAFENVENILKPLDNIYVITDLLKKVRYVRENLSQYAREPVIIAVLNQKGGVGKTTSTINIGAGLSQLGKKVLLIDFDPQSNLTEGLGIHDNNFQNSIYEVLKRDIKCRDAVLKHNDLSFIPANVLLARFERERSGEDKDIFLLRDALKGLYDYDYILIDCLPSLGLLTLNALFAANEIFVPIQPDYFSVSGISKINDAINYINEKFSKKIKITGIICTFWNQRRNNSREIMTHIKEKYGDKLFETCIRDSNSLKESTSYGKTIFEHQFKSNGAKDYMDLCGEVINRGNNRKSTA